MLKSSKMAEIVSRSSRFKDGRLGLWHGLQMRSSRVWWVDDMEIVWTGSVPHVRETRRR